MENPTRGILLLIAATFMFSISDVFAKILGARLHVIEIGWIRYLVSLVIVLAVQARMGRVRVRVRFPGQQVARGLAMVCSMMLFFVALRFMPIADAAAVGFVSPLMITALSVPLLGEVVGLRRWAAIGVGFAGVLIVMRPGTGAFQPAALLVVCSSLSWAFASVFTRKLAGKEDAGAMMLWTIMVGGGVLSLPLPFVFTMPSLLDVAMATAIGVLVTAGQYWMIFAYRHASASMLAPFSYVQLIWSTTSGWLVFGQLPDEWTWVGAAVIMASGLYTLHRERVRARERAGQG